MDKTAINESGAGTRCGSDPSCWICLEEGRDLSGLPLMHNYCSCRGSSGFVHLLCIAEYATGKSKQWNGLHVRDFSKSWTSCPNCKQLYTGKFASALRNKFIAFVETVYPDDKMRLLYALVIKLYALEPDETQEIQDTADRALSVVEVVKTSLSPPMSLYEYEALAYKFLGGFHLTMGTKESARNAEKYYLTCLAIAEERGLTTLIRIVECNINLAKAVYEEDVTMEKLLEVRQKAYDLGIEVYGESAPSTIGMGTRLATTLTEARLEVEAKSLLTKMLAICKRVHGEGNEHTKHVALTFKSLNIQCEDESSKKC